MDSAEKTTNEEIVTSEKKPETKEVVTFEEKPETKEVVASEEKPETEAPVETPEKPVGETTAKSSEVIKQPDQPVVDEQIKQKQDKREKSEAAGSNGDSCKNAKSVYDFIVKDASGNDVPLSKYQGHVLLIVNIASKCGLTATNNRELTELKGKYENKGLRILGFPCNQFLGQEPGTNEEIACFLNKRNANFGDVFAKCDVNGNNAIPLYKYLKHKQSGTLGNFIKWNYTKFIVDKNGQPVERHGPNTSPSSLTGSIEKYL